MAGNAGEVIAKITVDVETVSKQMDELVSLMAKAGQQMSAAMGSAMDKMSAHLTNVAASMKTSLDAAAGVMGSSMNRMSDNIRTSTVATTESARTMGSALAGVSQDVAAKAENSAQRYTAAQRLQALEERRRIVESKQVMTEVSAQAALKISLLARAAAAEAEAGKYVKSLADLQIQLSRQAGQATVYENKIKIDELRNAREATAQSTKQTIADSNNQARTTKSNNELSAVEAKSLAASLIAANRATADMARSASLSSRASIKATADATADARRVIESNNNAIIASERARAAAATAAANVIVAEKNKEIAAIRAQAAEDARNSRPQGNSTLDMAGGLARSLAGMAGIGSVAIALKEAASTASDMQRLRIQIEGVMGSAEKGEQTFEWLKAMSKNMPIASVDNLAAAFIRMRTRGIDPAGGALEGMVNYVSRIGRPMSELNPIIEQLAQGWGKNKLLMDDIKPLINRGVDVYGLLARALETTNEEIMKMAKAGKVAQPEIQKLIDQMGKESVGAAARMSSTIGGSWESMLTKIKHGIDEMQQRGAFNWMIDGIKAVQTLLPAFGFAFESTFILINAALNGLKTFWNSSFGLMINDMKMLGDQSKTSKDDVVGIATPIQMAVFAINTAFAQMGASFAAAVAVIKQGALSLKSYFTGAAENISLFWQRAKGEIDDKELALKLRAVQENTFGAGKGFVDRLRGDFKAINDELEAGMVKAGDAANKYGDKLKAQEPARLAPPKPNTDTKKEKGAASELDNLKEINDDQKALREKALADEGKYYSTANADDLKFWQANVNNANLKGRERVAVQRMIHGLEMGIAKEGLDQVKASLEAELSSVGFNFEAKKAILLQERAMYQTGTAEYEEITKRINAVDREAANQKKRLLIEARKEIRESRLNDIEEAENNAKSLKESGAITNAEMLAQLKDFAKQKLEIRKQEINEEIAIEASGSNDPTKIASLFKQLESLKRQHTKEMTKLDVESAKESSKYWRSIGSTMKTSALDAITAIIEGQGNMLKTLRGIWNNMLKSFIKTGVDMALAWAGKTAKEILITEAGEEAKVGSVGLASQMIALYHAVTGQTIATAKATEVTTVVTGNAAEAASGAAAAVAPTPFIGPSLAIAAFAGTMALVMGALHSASGGFDIGNFNPLTQLHAREMVLPAPIADGMRNMIANGGGANQSAKNAGVTNNHVHMNFSVKDYDSFAKSEADIHRQMFNKLKKYGQS